MRKRFLISFFLVFLMLGIPFTSVVNAQTKENEISIKIKNFDSTINEYILSANLDEEDNPGGWVTNTYNYVTVLINDIQIIISSRGIVVDTFNTLLDIFDLIKSLKESNRLIDYINVIINQFIPIVQDIIVEIQTIIGLVQAVSDLIQTTDEFISYIDSNPWAAPVLIRGTISGPEGPIKATVTSHGSTFNTNSSGFYYFELDSFREYLPYTYDVSASAEGYSDKEKSTGLLFPDGITTLNFQMNDDKESFIKSINMFLILRHFNSRLNIFLNKLFSL